MHLRCGLVIFLFCLLTACSTKPVAVVNPEQFRLMGNRLGQELIERKILDDNMDYIAASQSMENYGKILYNKLSPSFLFDDVEKQSASSFALSLASTEKVDIRSNGFSISTVGNSKSAKRNYATNGRRIDLNMVAISDWDDDGVQDWLVACRYIKKLGANPRIYYLAIPEVQVHQNASFQARIIGVYEDLGIAGRLYLRENTESSSQKPNSAADVPTGKVHHVVPGLKNITAPPKQESSQSKSTVQEKNL